MARDGVEAHERCGFELPGLVQAALRQARAMGFTNACLPNQGRLLEVLARGRDGGRIATAAAEVFRESRNVTVLCADWTAVGRWAPFDLLVLDAGAKVDDRLDPVDLLAPGAGLVIDDFTPLDRWPPHFGGGIDAARVHWLDHPRLLATEVRLTSSASSLVAIRR